VEDDIELVVARHTVVRDRDRAGRTTVEHRRDPAPSVVLGREQAELRATTAEPPVERRTEPPRGEITHPLPSRFERGVGRIVVGGGVNAVFVRSPTGDDRGPELV